MSGREGKLGFRSLGGDGVNYKVTPGTRRPQLLIAGVQSPCAEVTAGGPPRERPLPSPAAKAQEVLQAIRGYVRFFFGCRDCAGHFEQMAAASMHRVGSPDSAVLWLWSSHNKVNARLAGKKAPSKAGVAYRGRTRWGTVEAWTRGGRQDSSCPPGNTPCVTASRSAQSPFACSTSPADVCQCHRPIFQMKKPRLGHAKTLAF